MKKSTLLSFTGLSLFACASTNAATIAYAGTELNVDAKKTSLPVTSDSVGWRNTTDVKELDIDGDNVYGTDGFYMRGDNSVGARPAYIGTGFTNISGGGNNFGYADNPADPTGIDTFRTGFWGVSNTTGAQSFNMFSFTLSGTEIPTGTLRVGVYYDTFSTGTFTYTLLQTTGTGAGTATSGTLTLANDGYDFAFFDIEGGVAGDTFVLSAADVGAVNTTQYHLWGGVVFDSIPEPSTALLGGLGALMLLRRRRH